jgi:hypothetical protein
MFEGREDTQTVFAVKRNSFGQRSATFEKDSSCLLYAYDTLLYGGSKGILIEVDKAQADLHLLNLILLIFTILLTADHPTDCEFDGCFTTMLSNSDLLCFPLSLPHLLLLLLLSSSCSSTIPIAIPIASLSLLII